MDLLVQPVLKVFLVLLQILVQLVFKDPLVLKVKQELHQQLQVLPVKLVLKVYKDLLGLVHK
jgi:hypothetical protein